MAVKEKKVELIELFYDLIYVYAISRMTLLIEEPKDGVISLETFGAYIIASMVIIQAWLYMTNYVNRYCTWRWYEYVLTVLNMVAALLMANTITMYWIDASLIFVFSMMVMIGCIAALYAIQLYVQRQDTTVASHTLDSLILIMAIYGVALVMNLVGLKEESLFIIVLNIILGMFLPFFKRGAYDLKVGSFPHLVERLELLVIVTFGEGIVGITVFFDIMDLDLVSIMTFLILIFMFGSYVCQVHYLCNHHQEVNANKMVWSHYVIIMSVNLVTVAFLYFHNTEAQHFFTASLMMGSIALFFFSLYTTSSYHCPEFRATWQDFFLCVAYILIGAAVVFVFMDSPYGFLVGSLIATSLNFVHLWRKYSTNRCVNVIH